MKISYEPNNSSRCTLAKSIGRKKPKVLAFNFTQFALIEICSPRYSPTQNFRASIDLKQQETSASNIIYQIEQEEETKEEVEKTRKKTRWRRSAPVRRLA